MFNFPCRFLFLHWLEFNELPVQQISLNNLCSLWSNENVNCLRYWQTPPHWSTCNPAQMPAFTLCCTLFQNLSQTGSRCTLKRRYSDPEPCVTTWWTDWDQRHVRIPTAHLSFVTDLIFLMTHMWFGCEPLGRPARCSSLQPDLKSVTFTASQLTSHTAFSFSFTSQSFSGRWKRSWRKTTKDSGGCAGSDEALW